MVLTDVEGLYANWPDTDEVIATLTIGELRPIFCRRCPAG